MASYTWQLIGYIRKYAITNGGEWFDSGYYAHPKADTLIASWTNQVVPLVISDPLPSSFRIVTPTLVVTEDGCTTCSRFGLTCGSSGQQTWSGSSTIYNGVSVPSKSFDVFNLAILDPFSALRVVGIVCLLPVKRKQKYQVVKKETSTGLCVYKESGYTKIKSFRKYFL